MLPTQFTIRATPAKIGVNATQEVGKIVKKFKPERVLIVTGRTVGKSEICKRVKDSLEAEKIEFEVWNKVKPEPDVNCIMEGIEVGKDFDAYIGLGGGSAIDAAKLINLYTTYPPQDFFDYLPQPIGKGITVDKPLKPLIAIPTTSGSGSETTCAAVVKIPELNLKVGIVQECLLPNFAIVDPLNMTAPTEVVASSGMDALMHAIEAYTALPNKSLIYSGSNPVTDSLAEKAIYLISKNLRRSVHWEDLKSRYNMAIASYIAGIAFGNAGVHIGHALGHAIGGMKEIPHGICVSIVADEILDFIKPVVPKKVAKIRMIIGSVRKLMEDINLPTKLEDLNFGKDGIKVLAENAMKLRRIVSICPRKVRCEDLKAILEKSF